MDQAHPRNTPVYLAAKGYRYIVRGLTDKFNWCGLFSLMVVCLLKCNPNVLSLIPSWAFDRVFFVVVVFLFFFSDFSPSTTMAPGSRMITDAAEG